MLLDGRSVADFIRTRHIAQVRSLGFTPKLAIIMSPEADAAIRTYVRSTKSRYAGDIGAEVEVYEQAGDTAAIVNLVEGLNADKSVHGIILQLPFEGLDVEQVLKTIDPAKDVDGLHPESPFDPATPEAILWLLGAYGIEWQGKNVTVVGQGRVVGKPLADLIEQSGTKVVRCDISTTDLGAKTREADILVSATGQADLIRADIVKPDAVIVDAGTTEVNGNLVGDVDHSLYEIESLKVTPVPGGVGPMTVAVLFDHVIRAALASNS